MSGVIGVIVGGMIALLAGAALGCNAGFDDGWDTAQSRKISGIGKLRSLRAAGWDVEKIAVEFGCSGQTIRNTMKREGIE